MPRNIKALVTPKTLLLGLCLGLLGLFYYTQKVCLEHQEALRHCKDTYCALIAKDPTPSKPNVEATQSTLEALQTHIKQLQNYKHMFTPQPQTEPALILELQEYQDTVRAKAKLSNIDVPSASRLGFEDILKNGRIPAGQSIQDLFILKTIAAQAMDMLIQSHPQKILSCIPKLEKKRNEPAKSHLCLQFSGSTYTLRQFLNQAVLHTLPMSIADIRVQSLPQGDPAQSIIPESINLFDIKIEFPNQLIPLKGSSS